MVGRAAAYFFLLNFLVFYFCVVKTYIISPDMFNIISAPQWIYNNLWTDGESQSIKHTVRVTPHTECACNRTTPAANSRVHMNLWMWKCRRRTLSALCHSPSHLLFGCRQLQIDGIDSVSLSSAARIHSTDAPYVRPRERHRILSKLLLFSFIWTCSDQGME